MHPAAASVFLSLSSSATPVAGEPAQMSDSHLTPVVGRSPSLEQVLRVGASSPGSCPAGPYAGDPGLLVALQTLGMRDKLEPGEVLDAARLISALAASADACQTRCARCVSHEKRNPGPVLTCKQLSLTVRTVCK